MRRYPRGRIGPDDDGELAVRFAADHAHKIVRIDFGKPVEWLGLPPDHVREWCRLLLAKADELDPAKGG